MTKFAALAPVFLMALPCPVPACSLCGGMQSQSTLRVDMASAQIVLVGTITDARMGLAGQGTSDLAISRILKDEPKLINNAKVVLPRFLPIVNPKDPPRFIVFGREVKKGQIDFYHGRTVKSDALTAYLEGANRLTGKDQAKSLLYFFDFLDHPDETIAGDAFVEFARTNDKEVGEVAKHLPPTKIRQLLENPKTPSERLGLFAFLLSSSGSEKDAAFLRKLIDRGDERTNNALDGLLCGYINLKPKEGWELTRAILADGKRPFNQRFAATRTLRFFQAWKPVEAKAEVMRCVQAILPDGEMADLVIEDLRKWQDWELTPQVLALYGKPTHDAPIVKRSIARYALCCPRPEARQFITELRRRDAELVRELEEALAFEKGK